MHESIESILLSKNHADVSDFTDTLVVCCTVPVELSDSEIMNASRTSVETLEKLAENLKSN